MIANQQIYYHLQHQQNLHLIQLLGTSTIVVNDIHEQRPSMSTKDVHQLDIITNNRVIIPKTSQARIETS